MATVAARRGPSRAADGRTDRHRGRGGESDPRFRATRAAVDRHVARARARQRRCGFDHRDPGLSGRRGDRDRACVGAGDRTSSRRPPRRTQARRVTGGPSRCGDRDRVAPAADARGDAARDAQRRRWRHSGSNGLPQARVRGPGRTARGADAGREGRDRSPRHAHLDADRDAAGAVSRGHPRGHAEQRARGRTSQRGRDLRTSGDPERGGAARLPARCPRGTIGRPTHPGARGEEHRRGFAGRDARRALRDRRRRHGPTRHSCERREQHPARPGDAGSVRADRDDRQERRRRVAQRRPRAEDGPHRSGARFGRGHGEDARAYARSG